jgi:hypothetical protein
MPDWEQDRMLGVVSWRSRPQSRGRGTVHHEHVIGGLPGPLDTPDSHWAEATPRWNPAAAMEDSWMLLGPLDADRRRTQDRSTRVLSS